MSVFSLPCWHLAFSVIFIHFGKVLAPQARSDVVVSKCVYMSKVFQAGSLWDPKEETFRNYGQLLGPHDDFELVLWCDADVENEVKFTVAYVDPAQVIAGSYDVTLPKDQYVLVHKPVFRKPLRPGK